MTDSDFRRLTQHTDIYLIDQIFKDRYRASDKILDAGAGMGRNLPWFISEGCELSVVDFNAEKVAFLKAEYPSISKQIYLNSLDALPFKNSTFDHIICAAVLHFATSEEHFISMFSELIRVLKPKGTLFIRMTTDVGLTDIGEHLGNGVYHLNDDSNRFLLTRNLLSDVMKKFQLEFAAPFKTVVVDELRSMSVVVLQKK